MKSKFDALRLKEFLKDFYAVVGIRISVFDEEFNLVTEYPEYAPEFCATIRKRTSGLEACRKCDREAFVRTSASGRAHTYVCHAGLTEAITPIRLDGHIVGYAIFAHMLPQENYSDRVKEIFARSRKYFDSDRQILDAVRAIPTHPSSAINSSIRLLEAIAAFLQISKVTSWSDRDIAHRIDKFIKGNLDGELTNEVLCRHFFISRTKLYQLSLKNFGMSINKYVASLRMQKAESLLEETDCGIKEIAGKVGIPDYNYFCKLFKKTTGCTPGGFRRKRAAEKDGRTQ